jgi:hypothetical protein
MTETTAKPNNYKPYLVRMMNFIHQPDPLYTNETNFSVEELSNLTAKDFMRHVNYNVYGVSEPLPEQNNDNKRLLFVDEAQTES